MAASSSTYFLPGPSSSLINSKSLLIKQSPPPILHPIHQQFQHPLHRPFVPSNPMKSIPNSDTYHGTSLLTTNNNNTSSILTTNYNDDSSGGSNGHSLSQSMESINNIGSPDDEVR
jgi:hypothetical protein